MERTTRLDRSSLAESLYRIAGGAGIFANRISEVSAAALIAGLALFALVWITQLGFSSLSPPADNVEQLVWVGSLQWGYYKHPPFPTWLIWGPVQLFGETAWTSYAAGATTNLVSVVLFWRLLQGLRGRDYATVATLAVLCITYYSTRLNWYNHNTVLMLLSVSSASLCWKAHCTGQRRWWIGLGISLGLGLLTKYQMAITMGSVLVFWLSQRGWRDSAQREGLALALAATALVFMPHFLWLCGNDFGPIQYAIGSSLGTGLNFAQRLSASSNWLADQLLNRALFAWLFLFILFRQKPVHPEHHNLSALGREKSGKGEAETAFLLAWGLVPLALTLLLCLATGSALQLPWATAFLLFSVPVVMDILRGRGRRFDVPLGRAVIAFASIQMTLLIFSQLTSPFGYSAGKHMHRSFDSAALADVLQGPVRAALGGPLAFIAGPAELAGTVSLRLPNHPKVLIDGNLAISPWVNEDLLNFCGRMEIHEGASLRGWMSAGPRFPNLWWRVIAPQGSDQERLKVCGIGADHLLTQGAEGGPQQHF